MDTEHRLDVEELEAEITRLEEKAEFWHRQEDASEAMVEKLTDDLARKSEELERLEGDIEIANAMRRLSEENLAALKERVREARDLIESYLKEPYPNPNTDTLDDAIYVLDGKEEK